MKQTIRISALTAALVVSMTTLGMTGLSMAAYAEGTEDAGTATTAETDAEQAERAEYMQKINDLAVTAKTKIGESISLEWGRVYSIVEAVKNQCGQVGMGSGADYLLRFARNTLQLDTNQLNSQEIFAAVEGSEEYKTDTQLQESVRLAKADMEALIFGNDDNFGPNGYYLQKLIPASFDWSSVQGKTPFEIASTVANNGDYKAFANLGQMLNSLNMPYPNENTPLADVKQFYENFSSAVTKAEQYVASQSVVVPDNTTKTTAEGSTVTVAGALPNNVYVAAEKVNDIASVIPQFQGFGTQKNVVFDISLHDFTGAKYNLNGTVTVTIDLPAGFDSQKSVVVYIRDDGTVEDMPTEVADGKISFTTNHFSYYAIVERPNAGNTGTLSADTSNDAVVATSAVVASLAAIVTAGYVVVLIARHQHQK